MPRQVLGRRVNDDVGAQGEWALMSSSFIVGLDGVSSQIRRVFGSIMASKSSIRSPFHWAKLIPAWVAK